jgi:hypothetical protein
MDATRPRRTRDRARQKWYARYRQLRFARFLGFSLGDPAASPAGFAGSWLRGGQTVFLVSLVPRNHSKLGLSP